MVQRKKKQKKLRRGGGEGEKEKGRRGRGEGEGEEGDALWTTQPGAKSNLVIKTWVDLQNINKPLGFKYLFYNILVQTAEEIENC